MNVVVTFLPNYILISNLSDLMIYVSETFVQFH